MSKFKKTLFSCMAIGMLISAASSCNAVKIRNDLQTKISSPNIFKSFNKLKFSKKSLDILENFRQQLNTLINKPNINLLDYKNIATYIGYKTNNKFTRQFSRLESTTIYFLYQNKDFPNFNKWVRECVYACKKLELEGTSSTRLSTIINIISKAPSTIYYQMPAQIQSINYAPPLTLPQPVDDNKKLVLPSVTVDDDGKLCLLPLESV